MQTFILGQLQGGDSVFSYDDGKSYLDYKYADFVPSFVPTFDSPASEAKAKALCGDHKACLFDYGSTKDETIALDTKTSDKTFQGEEEKLGKRLFSHFDILSVLSQQKCKVNSPAEEFVKVTHKALTRVGLYLNTSNLNNKTLAYVGFYMNTSKVTHKTLT